MKILVLGIGNILMKDEGVGVRTIEYLQKEDLPQEVELLDGGTSTPLLFPEFAEADYLIVIDAVKGGMSPGSIYRLRLEDLVPPDNSPVSLHDLGLIDALQMASLINKAPQKVLIFGIEPKEIDWGMELSPEVEGCIPKVAKLVREEIKAILNPELRSCEDQPVKS